MDLSTTSLEQLGTFAHGHYKAGEKARDRAEQQMISAGLYLKEAKDRLDLRKNPNAPMNFAQFLLHHCPIGKSRAYEVISIADGRKTLEEVQQATTERSQKMRSTPPEEPTFRCATETTERTQDGMGHSQPKPKTFLDEAQAAHDALVKEIIALVKKQDTTTLLNIKELLQ